MSATSAKDPPGATNGMPNAGGPDVSVDVDHLIVGRELNFPIHDSDGVLLLAERSIIPPDLQEKLRARGIQFVVLHRDDVARATSPDSPHPARAAASNDPAIEQELAATAAQLAAGAGSPVRDRMARHGRTPFNPAFQAVLIEEFQSTAELVRATTERLVGGEALSADHLVNRAANCLERLIRDQDHAIAVSLELLLDSPLATHSLPVAVLSMALGIDLGLDDGHVRTVGLTGMLHDLGMALVPAEIRNKPGPLTRSELLEVQKHPRHTYDLLEHLQGIPDVVRVLAYQVHERLDGSGYPCARPGSAIPLLARIVSVADAYVAMTSDRPFRRSFLPYDAMIALLRQAKTGRLDPSVIRSLLRVLSLFPIGSSVVLSDGSLARVIRANGDRYTQPIVQRLRDAHGHPVDAADPQHVIDLTDSSLRILHALPALA